MPCSRAFRHAGRSLAGLFFLVATLVLLPACATFAATGSTTGEQKTAVILVNFQDNTSQPRTKAELDTLVFGQVSDFFWENSYQKTLLSGDTFGWFTIPVTTADCSWTSIAQEGNRAATAAGADLSAYTRFVYLYPNASGCVVGGGGDIGPAGEKRVFINGASGFTLQMIAHEMGHGFGLMHSDALDCDLTPIGNSCSTVGYGDAADTMGGEGHFNAFQKERLGWLGAAGAPPIATVTGSGRYAIAPYETTAAGAKALKILKSVDATTGQKTWYYVEYRQPTGFDALLAGRGNLTTGVLVHTGTVSAGGIATSLLLDMTPNSSDWIAYEFQDGALGVGRSFVDANAGVAISLAAADAGGATVDVSLGAPPPPTCTRAAPTLALSGPTTAAAAGSTLSYTVTVGNRDSSACTATSFNLARSVPPGWSGTLAATSLSLSPGASASTILSVTSPGSAAAGDYGIGIGSSSSVGSIHVASAATSYAVAAGTTALTESVGTDKTAYLRGQTVYMSARVLAGGAPVSGASVRFTVTAPGGGNTLLSATTASDGYARTSLKLGKSKGAAGSYQLRADATKDSASTSASTGFSVR